MKIKRRLILCSKRLRMITIQALRKLKTMYVAVRISKKLLLKVSMLGNQYPDREREIRVHYSLSHLLQAMTETMLPMTLRIMMTQVQVLIMTMIMSPRFQKMNQPRKTYQRIKESSRMPYQRNV